MKHQINDKMLKSLCRVWLYYSNFIDDEFEAEILLDVQKSIESGLNLKRPFTDDDLKVYLSTELKALDF